MARARLAVVTGASSGIGQATAVELGARRWRVACIARNRERLAETAQRVEAAGGSATVEAVDAADAPALLAAAERIRARDGVPDLIVNSAGAGVWKYLEETPPAEADAMLDAPYRAAYHTTYAFLGDLLARGRGVIVHVGSPAARQPWPGATAYTVGRWALRGLHEALVVDLARTGVHSCHVVFGEVSSPYFEHNPDSYERAAPRFARLLPVTPPATCGAIIADLADRPRREVVHPRTLRALFAVERLAPWLTRWALVATGRRH